MRLQNRISRRSFIACQAGGALGALATLHCAAVPAEKPASEPSATRNPEPDPLKHALLVAVNDYKQPAMNQPLLKFAIKDAEALGTVLRKSGFSVTLLAGKEATKKRISDAVAKLREQGGGGGIVITGLFGHGVLAKFPEGSRPVSAESCFCPWDTQTRHAKENGQLLFNSDGMPMLEPVPDTVLRLRDILTSLATAAASHRVVFADCCRKSPNRARYGGLGFGAGFSTQDLPTNSAVIFGCAAEGESFEHDNWQHGAFTKSLLEQMASLIREGRVATGNLGDGVKQKVKALTRIQDPQAFQTDSIDLRITPEPLLAPFDAISAQTAQRAWSIVLETPEVMREPTTGMSMSLIPTGEYTMGGSEEERVFFQRIFGNAPQSVANNPSQQRGLVSKPFYIGTREVTVGQFRRFVAAAMHRTEAERSGRGGWGWNQDQGVFEGPNAGYTWKTPGFDQTDDHPVVNVSWNDASEFCRWLSQATGLAFRLPTEMEWEFACRAGNTTLFWNGNERDKLPDIANIADRSAKEVLVRYEKWTFENGRDRHVFTAPVGSFPANAFGLSDMHGNVLEWCQDQRQIGFRAKQQLSAIKNEHRFGAYRIVRSSSWASGAASCRSAHRVWFPPETRLNDLGFRVVCEC